MSEDLGKDVNLCVFLKSLDCSICCFTSPGPDNHPAQPTGYWNDIWLTMITKCISYRIMKPSAFRFVPFEPRSHYDFFFHHWSRNLQRKWRQTGDLIRLPLQIDIFSCIVGSWYFEENRRRGGCLYDSRASKTPLGNTRGESFLSILFE